MWYMWTVLLVSSALAAAEGQETPAPAPAPAATRAPPRTLDRQGADLVWRSWLTSPESGNQNAPARRITTKSLFITPLVCPKGQRLDRNACVQVVTIDKNEHERILLEELNARFPSSPSGDIVYDYGDDEPGPLQLSIPIGFDPHAAPLQAQEPSAQAHELQPNYVKVDKKDEKKPNIDASIEAELELLKLQHAQHTVNDTSFENTDILNHNVLNNLLAPIDKPKRDSPIANSTESESQNISDEGQKELVYGHVNVDPVLYDTETQDATTTSTETEKPSEAPPVQINATLININSNTTENNNKPKESHPDSLNTTVAEIVSNSTVHVLKKEGDQTKLNPETDYGDIGEAIKLISRYAEVTTDDNFNKFQKKQETKEDSILGTRTRLQHRRNKPKPESLEEPALPRVPSENVKELTAFNVYPKNDAYYRYPWQSQHAVTPPPNYPFRHLQDYWPGRNQVGGVYNTAHENPRRHHHAYSHNYFRPHGVPYPAYPGSYPGIQEVPGQFQAYGHRAAPRHGLPMRPQSNNQDLYSLLGLRHWFSSEGTSKR